MFWTSRAPEGDSNPMIPKEELALWNVFLHIAANTRKLTRTTELVTFPLFRRNIFPVRTNTDILGTANINQSPASVTHLKCCISVPPQNPSGSCWHLSHSHLILEAIKLLLRAKFCLPVPGSSTMPTQSVQLLGTSAKHQHSLLKLLLVRRGYLLLKRRSWMDVPFPRLLKYSKVVYLLRLFQNK